MTDAAEEAVSKSGCRFATVNAIAKRSKQLTNGVPPLVTNANPEKPAMTALREIAIGVVEVRRNGRTAERGAGSNPAAA